MACGSVYPHPDPHMQSEPALAFGGTKFNSGGPPCEQNISVAHLKIFCFFVLGLISCNSTHFAMGGEKILQLYNYTEQKINATISTILLSYSSYKEISQMK